MVGSGLTTSMSNQCSMKRSLPSCFQIHLQEVTSTSFYVLSKNFLFLYASLCLAMSKCLFVSVCQFVCVGVDKQKKNISQLMNKLIINLLEPSISLLSVNTQLRERKVGKLRLKLPSILTNAFEFMLKVNEDGNYFLLTFSFYLPLYHSPITRYFYMRDISTGGDGDNFNTRRK